MHETRTWAGVADLAVTAAIASTAQPLHHLTRSPTSDLPLVTADSASGAMHSGMKVGHVSVAICTWNRCESLRRTLEGMLRLQVPVGVTWDLIVVNNNGTDATDEVVTSFTDRLPVRLLHEATPGLSWPQHSTGGSDWRHRAMDRRRRDCRADLDLARCRRIPNACS